MKNFSNKLKESGLYNSPISGDIVYALFRFYCGISISIGAGFAKVMHLIDEDKDRNWSNLAFGVPDWFVEQVAGLGFTYPSSVLWAYLAVYGEFVGGFFIAVGFLTRLSALQLALQFFVVSFIWYDAPEFMGMYYQQLIFWSFVLIFTLGGGCISMDRLIQRRKNLGRSVILLSFFIIPEFLTAQSVERIPFTISNPSFGKKKLEIRYSDTTLQVFLGYGYNLGMFQTHKLNMPVGTLIYQIKSGRRNLIYTLAETDRDSNVDLCRQIKNASRTRKATRQMMVPEVRISKISYSERRIIKSENVQQESEMVQFILTSRALLPLQVFIRLEFPEDQQDVIRGFSRRMSIFQYFPVQYPKYTKLYLCSKPFWTTGGYEEELILEVHPEMEGNILRL